MVIEIVGVPIGAPFLFGGGLLPFVQCKDCLERQGGRCLRGIRKDGCYGATTAARCMVAAEIKADPLPRKFKKEWYE